MSVAATTSIPPALQMRGVAVGSARGTGVAVVEEVDWTVAAGEFWVVGAPQLSGKSDFLMMAGGLTAPMGGDYFFLGERMPLFEESRLGHRLKLGLVFDGGRLISQLTVAENLALPLRYHGHLAPAEIELRVTALLELTVLTPWAHHKSGTLGRSWQQRVGLARALALQPEVLLLDSPLTGLDVRHLTWWLDFLDQLSRGHDYLAGRPMTLVATADDLRPWRRHANRVACLAARRLRVLGDWQAAEASREAVVRELLPEAPSGD